MGFEQYAENDRFDALLGWSIGLQKRYNDLLHVGLIEIEYNAGEVMHSTFGAGDAVLRLREVALCLQQCFRDTDAIARYGTTFWVLVPMTQMEPVSSKVQGVLSTAKANGLDIAQTQVRVHMLADHQHWLQSAGNDSQPFLSYLQQLR